MNDRSLITTGAIGAALAAICCATPLLAVVLGGIGLSAWLAKADYVVIPVLILGVGAVGPRALPPASRCDVPRYERHGSGARMSERQNLRSRRHRQRHGRSGDKLPCARGGMVGCGHRSSAVRRNLCPARLRSKKNADQWRRGDRHGPAHARPGRHRRARD